MPDYDDWMDIDKREEKPKKEMTDDQMLNMAKMLNAAFGGEVIYK